MFTLDDLLSPENVDQAIATLLARRGGAGPDGMPLSEIADHWKANGLQIEEAIRSGRYRPGAAACFEVVTGSGKRREVAGINAVDRLLERMLHQQLTRCFGSLLLPHSFAYQSGKSPLDAAMFARECVASGCAYVCEIDLKDYFSTLNLDLLEQLVGQHITDSGILALIHAYLHREVMRDGSIEVPSRGLLQGSSLSPVLANLYLHSFDKLLEDLGLLWFRFSDNVCVYFAEAEEASAAYKYLTNVLTSRFDLTINVKKSGVYEATGRRILGYDLIQTEIGIEVRRHAYKPAWRYDAWHSTNVSRSDGAYHILQDGIVTRKDYSLLFENEDERHHIPVEVTTQLNVYGNVTITPEALATMCRHGIRVAYVDRYGDLMGTFVPEGHAKTAEVFLKQALLYNDPAKRLELARKLEVASIHNMRANLRYYAQRGMNGLDQCVSTLSDCIDQLDGATDISGLMLIEARARRVYYTTFAEILVGERFDFTSRTRRPPKDRGNAMVSFGNSVLYNYVLQCIWRTSLDPKIGIVHATNRRSYSLNLDIADLFKPVVVDRVIFALVNRREMDPDAHFVESEGGGVLMSREGKQAFLRRFYAKLDDRITVKGRKLSYRQLIADEAWALQRYVVDGTDYHPYKYW